jgi:phage terminase small subunit
MPRNANPGDVLPGEEPEVVEDPVVAAFERVAGEEKLTKFDLRVRLFLFHYLRLFDATKAAKAMGVSKGSASVIGSRYLRHPKTQELMRNTLRDADEELDILRQEVTHLALREATNDEMCPGSQAARVKALDLLAKILGMGSTNVNVKNQGSPGVLVAPMAATEEEWAELARASQDVVTTSNPDMAEETLPHKVKEESEAQEEETALTHSEEDDTDDPLNVL